MTSTKHAFNKYALLIGIQEYPHLEKKDLQGAHNDVIELSHLLVDRFGFAEDHLQALGGYLSRADILRAFDELCERVGPEDQVLISYSGHGSRLMRDGAWVESIVPSDSGRPAPHGDGSANRDIQDVEIDHWVRRLNRKTRHVTLIFDCCHSGSITRDPFSDEVRGVAADPRVVDPPVLEPLMDLIPEKSFPTPEVVTDLQWSLAVQRHALVLASCRAQEMAKEFRPSVDGNTYSHGVFTYFLCQALRNASTSTTWRNLFERVAPQVTATFASQHPVIEGPWDTTLFGKQRRWRGGK